MYLKPKDAGDGNNGDDAHFAEKEYKVADGVDGGDAPGVEHQSRKGRTGRGAKRLPKPMTDLNIWLH